MQPRSWFVLFFLVGLLVFPTLSSANPKTLQGRWKLLSMTYEGKARKLPQGISVVMTFFRNGTYSFVRFQKGKRRPRGRIRGRWRLQGNVLITEEDKDKKIESFHVKVSKRTARIARIPMKNKSARGTRPAAIRLLRLR